MRLFRADFYICAAIFIISILFNFDLFLTPGRLTSFDLPFHITNMAQFYLALKDWDFPVVWTDGAANYGLPLSIVAHQLTSYLGAVLVSVSDPLNAFKIVSFLGIFLSSLFYYFFLRIYFKPIPSFAATFLYTFTSYKIINFYIRGATPEIFAAAFLPLILIGMYLFIKRKNIWGLILTCISFFLLSLNHPMMLLIYSFIYVPYLLLLVFFNEDGLVKFKIRKLISPVILLIFIATGVGMASYYLLPLNLEIKYFYYGQIANHLTPDSFLSFPDFFRFDWKYFTDKEVITRGHIIFPGIIEILSVGVGIILIIWKWIKEKKKNIGLLEFAVIISLLILFFTTPTTSFLYERVNLLSNIQFPWRMLSAFVFFPGIIYAYALSKLNRNYLALVFILIVSVLQFPQIYGKNYTLIPKDVYFFSSFNPHSVLMNTIWSGKSEDYPIRKSKPEIIEGQGRIVQQEVRNSSRSYKINADTPLKLVDYTFYFPGWKVWVDGKIVPIEFQNPNYRGLITYQVPEGGHDIYLKFEDTRVRQTSKLVSLFFISIFVVLIIFRNKLAALIKLKNEND